MSDTTDLRAKAAAAIDLPRVDPDTDDTMGKTIPITERRLFDLVRYMRSELQDAGLITMGEWTWLTTGATPDVPGAGSPSRKRLEEYDELAARLAAMTAERDELKAFQLGRPPIVTHATAEQLLAVATSVGHGPVMVGGDCLREALAAATARERALREVRRYNVSAIEYHNGDVFYASTEVEPSDEGAWVKWEDVQAALAACPPSASPEPTS
jgi:hypothetical protein